MEESLFEGWDEQRAKDIALLLAGANTLLDILEGKNSGSSS